jgi:hypothetical protein
MSELSPAAQEVFWAFNKAASGEPYDWHYLPAVAAALRAAANHCHFQEIREADHTTRRWICVDELLAIATELEAQ